MPLKKFVLGTVAAVALAANAAPALAQTVDVTHERGSGGFTIGFVNPCAPGDGTVTVTGTIFSQIRYLADGTQQREEHATLTGTSSTGVPYRYNVQFKGDPFRDVFDQTIEEISLTSSPNAHLHSTQNGTTISCSG